jgi:catechol 2,3-dioxygenase-like lactoylglutathione lyase family enzyme
MDTVEIKAFVPAKDFDLSKRFYEDLGFSLAWFSEAWHICMRDRRAFYCRDSM